jgi:hypothetical protein
VPPCFTLRARLQLAAARRVNILHFRNTGEVRLSADAYGNAAVELAGAGSDFAGRSYAPGLVAIALDEGSDTVTVHASGTTQIFLALSPRFTVPVVAESRFRMHQRCTDESAHGEDLHCAKRSAVQVSVHGERFVYALQIGHDVAIARPEPTTSCDHTINGYYR